MSCLRKISRAIFQIIVCKHVKNGLFRCKLFENVKEVKIVETGHGAMDWVHNAGKKLR